jgi:hypothetical protein
VLKVDKTRPLPQAVLTSLFTATWYNLKMIFLKTVPGRDLKE